MSNLMIAGGDIEKFEKTYGDTVDFKKIRLTLDAMKAESKAWHNISSTPTPYEHIENRPHDDLEYVKEFYVLSEFDRLFPGWSQEQMESTYINEIRVVKQTGYMLCPVVDLVKGEVKIVKRWTVGAKQIEGKKDDKSQPSKPEYVFASADTVWIRRMGKRFGIALDIYTQAITPEMQSMFEDKIRYWGAYAESFKATASTIEKGKAFRNFLRALPSVEQTARFLKIVEHEALSESPDKKHQLWLAFVKFKNRTEEETYQLNSWLGKFESQLNIKTEGDENV